VNCGRFLGDQGDLDEPSSKPPWHFWILVAALVAYLGWRLVEVVIWLVTGNWPS